MLEPLLLLLLGLKRLAAVSIHKRVRCGRVFRIFRMSVVLDSGDANDPGGDTHNKAEVDVDAPISHHMRG